MACQTNQGNHSFETLGHSGLVSPGDLRAQPPQHRGRSLGSEESRCLDWSAAVYESSHVHMVSGSVLTWPVSCADQAIQWSSLSPQFDIRIVQSEHSAYSDLGQTNTTWDGEKRRTGLQRLTSVIDNLFFSNLPLGAKQNDILWEENEWRTELLVLSYLGAVCLAACLTYNGSWYWTGKELPASNICCLCSHFDIIAQLWLLFSVKI